MESGKCLIYKGVLTSLVSRSMSLHVSKHDLPDLDSSLTSGASVCNTSPLCRVFLCQMVPGNEFSRNGRNGNVLLKGLLSDLRLCLRTGHKKALLSLLLLSAGSVTGIPISLPSNYDIKRLQLRYFTFSKSCKAEPARFRCVSTFLSQGNLWCIDMFAANTALL